LTKKIIILIFTLSIIVSGCGEKKNTDTSSEKSAMISENSAVISTYPVPENGWTASELFKTISVFDKSSSEPFNIAGFGEYFSVFNPLGAENVAMLTYKGKKYPYISLSYSENGKTEAEYRELTPQGIVIGVTSTVKEMEEMYDFDDDYREITVNGIGLGSNKSEVVKAFGEPDKINDENYYFYKDPNRDGNSLGVSFSESGELKNITIINR
jgi:hypothetical protein